MVTEEAELGETNILSAKSRCCCCIPILRSRRSGTVGFWWETIRTAQNGDRWWTRGVESLKKIREWSEIVAGPKWKTFIRRFNRNRSGGSRNAKFQYDALSYSLNFDEGPARDSNSEESDVRLRDFSSRYVSFPAPAKSSISGPSQLVVQCAG